MSRTPHASIVLLAALCLAVSSLAVARTRAHAPKRAAAHSVAVPAVKLVADARSVSTNAAAVARQFDRWLDDIETSGDGSGLAVAVVGLVTVALQGLICGAMGLGLVGYALLLRHQSWPRVPVGPPR